MRFSQVTLLTILFCWSCGIFLQKDSVVFSFLLKAQAKLARSKVFPVHYMHEGCAYMGVQVLQRTMLYTVLQLRSSFCQRCAGHITMLHRVAALSQGPCGQ